MARYIDADLLKNTIQSAVKDTNDRLKDRLDSENLEILEMIKDLFFKAFILCLPPMFARLYTGVG